MRGDDGDDLSPRQYELIRLLLLGKLDKEIAFSMGLKTNTVKIYMCRIRWRLGLKNRFEVMNWAMSPRQCVFIDT